MYLVTLWKFDAHRYRETELTLMYDPAYKAPAQGLSLKCIITKIRRELSRRWDNLFKATL